MDATRAVQLLLSLGVVVCAAGCPRSSTPLRPQVNEPERMPPNADPRGMAGSAPPPEQLPASTRALAKGLAEAICAAREACVGASALREIELDEPCAERVAAELRARELYHLAAAIDSGHVFYDPSNLPQCLAAVRALACDVAAVRFPGPCASVLVPNVAIGGGCLIDAECENGGFCEGETRGACPSTCRPRGAQGAACRTDAQCADGLACQSDECARPPQQGMACGGEDSVACAFGFVCVGGDATRDGACARARSLRVAQLGEPCDPNGEHCEDGLTCAAQTDGTTVCAEGAVLDGSCHPGVPDPCPAGAFCAFDPGAAAGVCQPLPEAGEPCAPDARCGAGLVCLDDAAAAPRCEPLQGNGGACSDDSACRSGLCIDAVCRARAICG